MLLKLQQVTKSYGFNQVKPVLTDLSMELDVGKTMAILGPSGSGKSTLLNIIGALDKPDAGKVLFDGKDIVSQSDKELASFRNNEIGFVFQSHHLLPQCTVMENVLIPTLTIKDTKVKKQTKVRAMELIQEVGLWEHKDKFPGTLSGGECQRVATIRALINKPRLLLADEPTGSLDSDNAHNIIDLLLKLNSDFKTAMIVVTHSEEIGRKMENSFKLVNGKLAQLK